LATLAQAKDIPPEDMVIHDAYMSLYNDQGKYDLAIQEIKAIQALNPQYVEAQLNLGIVEEKRGNYAGAIDALTKYVKAKPDNLLAHEVLLSIYTRSTERKFLDKN